MLTPLDLHLFGEGTHHRMYEQLGVQRVSGGFRFSVWAPNATAVSVAGDFNGYRGQPLRPVDASGIWSAVIAEAHPGNTYKFRITTATGETVDRAAPYATHTEHVTAQYSSPPSAS